MRCLVEVMVIGVLVSSVSAALPTGCNAMKYVYNDLFRLGTPKDVPSFPFGPRKGHTCGSPRVSTCCSKRMETWFNRLFRSLVNNTRGHMWSLEARLKEMRYTKERQLGYLQLNFTDALFKTASNCRGRTLVTKAVEALFQSVLLVYDGTHSSMRDAVVTFFYRLSVQYIQSTVGNLSPLTAAAPELTGTSDYNFKLCVANWGHHRHVRQTNANLMAISCCLDKFILYSKRIHDSIHGLAVILAEVKSNLMHICTPCKQAFLQNMICHRCNGHPELGSCPSLCIDLILKCFPWVVALNRAWNDVLKSIEELINAINNLNGICFCMNSIQLSLKAYCPSLGIRRNDDLKSTQDLLRSLTADCGDPRLTYGDDGSKGIFEFLKEMDIPIHQYIQSDAAPTRINTGSSRDNGPIQSLSDSIDSCLGIEANEGSGKPTTTHGDQLHIFRDIMLPQGQLFSSFCSLKAPSTARLVSSSGTCWNGTTVVDVTADKRTHRSRHSDHGHGWRSKRSKHGYSAALLANPVDCADSKQNETQSLYRTCCTSPEMNLSMQLIELARKNREFLCQDPNTNDSNSFCKQCGSDIGSKPSVSTQMEEQG